MGPHLYRNRTRVDRLEPATGHIKHYTVADGLASGNVGVGFRDHQGALWFSTTQGLARLIPEPDQPRSPPPILISGLRIAGVTYPISELGQTEVPKLELETNQNQNQYRFRRPWFWLGRGPQVSIQTRGRGARLELVDGSAHGKLCEFAPGNLSLFRAGGKHGWNDQPDTRDRRILHSATLVAALVGFGAGSDEPQPGRLCSLSSPGRAIARARESAHAHSDRFA